MGDIGNELFSHLIDLDLLVNVVLQLFVGILQGTNGILQAVGKRIHAPTQNTHLILRIILVSNIKIQF